MIVTKEIHVSGMQCTGCVTIIEEALYQIDGILFAKADYDKATVEVSFDADKTGWDAIQQACAAKGYTLELFPVSNFQKIIKIILSLLALAGLFAVIMLARKFGTRFSLPEITSQTGNGMIFLVGLLTGLHCVGMCGSFIIGYTARDAGQNRSAIGSHIWYGAGKTLSYAMLGAIFGFAGSFFHITPLVSGISIGLAGAFLILYGLNMLHVFSIVKAIRIKQPLAMASYATKTRRKSKSPFFIGFFSGFILGCGPLQVMYVMAAGNGDALEGAKFLTLFGLGTLPALFCFGLLTRMLTLTMTRRFVQASGIILIVLGSMMLNKGVLKARSGDETKKGCCHEQVDETSH